MHRLLIVVALAVAALALVAIPSAASADWSSGKGPNAKIACGGTVSCCDSPIADRYRSRSLDSFGAAVVRSIRRACTGSGLECGRWHYVGSPSSGHWWMFIPCRG